MINFVQTYTILLQPPCTRVSPSWVSILLPCWFWRSLGRHYSNHAYHQHACWAVTPWNLWKGLSRPGKLITYEEWRVCHITCDLVWCMQVAYRERSEVTFSWGLPILSCYEHFIAVSILDTCPTSTHVALLVWRCLGYNLLLNWPILNFLGRGGEWERFVWSEGKFIYKTSTPSSLVAFSLDWSCSL